MAKPRTKTVAKARTYDGAELKDVLDRRPMTWVDANEIGWDGYCKRWADEHGYEPWPMYSAYTPGTHPGWFFPQDWTR